MCWFSLLILFFAQFSHSQISTIEKLTVTIPQNTSMFSEISSGDFDGDGDQDIVYIVENGAQKGLYLCENFGELNFSFPKLIASIPQIPKDVDILDVDMDGYLDILVGSFSDGSIKWYKNVTNLNFVLNTTISNQIPFLHSFEIADFDNDGDIDIISGLMLDSCVVLIENLGFGNFAPQDTILFNYASPMMKVGDMNNDGYPDLIIGSYNDGDSISFVKNLGGLTFGQKQVISSYDQARCLKISDINNDGFNDVIFSTLQDSIYTILNIGSDNFGATTTICPSYLLHDFFGMVDFDEDGDLDILTNQQTSSFRMSVILNDGSGNYGNPISKYIYSPGNKYYFQDLNNDGKPEFLINSGSMLGYSLRENLGQGNFSNEQPLLNFSISEGIVEYLDMDNDGNKDIVISPKTNNTTTFNGSNLIMWYKNFPNSTRRFGRPRIIEPNTSINRMAKYADIDGDGFLDVVGSIKIGIEKYIFWNKNLGNGNFDTLVILFNNVDNYNLFLTDFDLDSYIDIVYLTPNNLFWAKNINGTGTFSTPFNIGSASLENKIYIEDFDLDGDKDVLTQDLTGGNLYKNQGSMTFTMSTLPTNGPYSLSDKNGDGLLDLVSFFYNPAFVGPSGLNVYHNNGNNFSINPTTIPITIPTSIQGAPIEGKIVNLNDDNIEDFIFYGQSGQPTATYSYVIYALGIDDTTFAQSQSFYTASSVLGITTANQIDYDNDGDDDFFIGTNNGVGGDQGMFLLKNQLLNPVQLSGRLFVDQNQNNQNDSTDLGAPFIEIQTSPQSDYSFTSSDGKYIINLSDTLGTYVVYPTVPQYWSISTDSSQYNVNVDTSYYQLDSLDFGITPDTLVYEAYTSITGGFPRCSQIVNYWINTTNVGTMLLNGIVKLSLDDSLTYISSDVIPDSVVGNNIFWHIDSLNVFQSKMINLQVEMPDFNSMSDTVTSISETIVHDSIGGIHIFSDTIFQKVVCAYDPNDKSVIPSGIGNEGYIPFETGELDYTIRFQNTGNDTAINVKIEDQLSQNVILNSLKFIASSHPIQISVNQNGKVTFLFENIMLPDSNVNEIASQGFVRFSIKIKPNLPEGSKILNTGNIYFDQNPLVATNTVQNTLSCQFYDASINYTGSNTFCNHDAPISFTNENPIGGIYSGAGMTGSQFIPVNGVANQNLIYYTYTNIHNCVLKDSLVLINNSAPPASINFIGSTSFCPNSPNIDLNQAIPIGGIFSGSTGIVGQMFNPNMATLGANNVYYTYSNSSGCYSQDSIIFIVDPCLDIFESNSVQPIVYPNPTNNDLYLSWGDSNKELHQIDIKLKNMQGQNLLVEKVEGINQFMLNLEDFSNGIYLLILYDVDSGYELSKTMIIKQ